MRLSDPRKFLWNLHRFFDAMAVESTFGRMVRRGGLC